MALTWEPRWEPIEIEYAGIKIRTCRDKITGMIACPICINAARECLGYGDKAPRYKDVEYSFFFTERDLIIHIKNHFEKQWAKERKEVFIVEEELEE